MMLYFVILNILTILDLLLKLYNFLSLYDVEMNIYFSFMSYQYYILFLANI